MKTRNLAAAVLALGLSACAAEYSAVGIQAICAPPDPDTTSGACVYPATCDATFAGTPVLDVATAILDFRLPLQINNLLEDNSSGPGRINTNDAFIQSFEITYAGASLQPWSVPAADHRPHGRLVGSPGEPHPLPSTSPPSPRPAAPPGRSSSSTSVRTGSWPRRAASRRPGSQSPWMSAQDASTASARSGRSAGHLPLHRPRPVVARPERKLHLHRRRPAARQ